MQAIWNRIEDTVERIDNYTHGAAEMLLIMTLGSIVATTLYAILSVVVMGYIEIFTLITGSF
jgi:hypothetical protein